MKFDKRFNIKKFVTFSAVALAMIGAGGIVSTVNTNTHVHADSGVQEDLKAVQAQNEKDTVQIKRDEAHDAYEGAKKDPSLLAYDLEYAPDRIKGHKRELLNRLTPQQRKTIRQLMAFENGKSNYAPSDKDLGGDSLSSTQLDAYAKKHTPTPKLPYFLRSNKTTKSIRANRQAINNDKKLLSTRRARKSMNNYKHNHRSNRYIKSLISANKDLTKREKNLALTAKSNHKIRSTKRNFHRKSLKRIRNHKNKNIKRNRNHKRINKRNRDRKHMKRNTHKHTRRNHRDRK